MGIASHRAPDLQLVLHIEIRVWQFLALLPPLQEVVVGCNAGVLPELSTRFATAHSDPKLQANICLKVSHYLHKQDCTWHTI
jgi:hypothetical protein